MSEFTILGAAVVSAYVVLGYVKPKLAFTTAPVAAMIVAYTAVESNVEEFIVVAPVLFVGTLLAVAASGVRRESRQWSTGGPVILLTMAACCCWLASGPGAPAVL
jgi:hypothetical protein